MLIALQGHAVTLNVLKYMVLKYIFNNKDTFKIYEIKIHVFPHHTSPYNVLNIYLVAKLIYNSDYHSIYMQILYYLCFSCILNFTKMQLTCKLRKKYVSFRTRSKIVLHFQKSVPAMTITFMTLK